MSLRRLFLTYAVVVPVASIGVGLAISRSHAAFAQPGTPRVVYLGLSKNLVGEGSSQSVDQYRCAETGKTLSMQVVSTTLRLQVSSNRPCDEVPNAGTLKLQWRIVLHADQGGFGTHSGSFT
jgi:hypothetical protein